MDWYAILFLIIGGFLMLVLLGIPINFALGLSFIPIMVLLASEPATYVIDLFALIAFRDLTSLTLVAVPLFVLMGQIMGTTSIGRNLYDGLQHWVGWIRGGLAITTILTNTVVAAIVGASMISAATTGPITIPGQVKQGYDKRLAIGAESAGSSLAMLIPPSIPMVMYCVMTDLSIGHLFMAGLVPGILLSFLFCVYIIVRVTLRPQDAPKAPRSSWRQRAESTPKLVPPVVLVLVVLIALYTGLAGINEVAAIGCAGMFLIAFATREFRRANFEQSLLRTVQLTGFFALLIVCARFMGFGFSYFGISTRFVTWITGLDVPRWAVILILMGLYFLLGMLMNASALIVVTMPFVMPIVVNLGYDLVWFGVVLILNLQMGAITPPIGVNLFALKAAVPDIEMWEVVQGSLPFMLLMAAMIIVLLLLPQLALWLPGTM